jgi:hypothetical protein
MRAVRTLPQPKPWWFLAALGAYVALAGFLFFTHLPWRDEGQAWLWAKQIASLRDLFIVPGEGHPPLWFWLLKPMTWVLPFDVARWFSLALTILNGVLLRELLKDRFWVFAVVLATAVPLFFYGVMFRPYTLILSLTLIALILTQRGRTVTAAWLLAVGVGLHFYASFIFGLWGLVQLLRRHRIVPLVGPAALAALFALLAVLSARGNPDSTLTLDSPVFGPVFDFVGGFGMDTPAAPLVAIAIVVLMALEFRRDRVTLAALLVATVLFACFTYFVFGNSARHLSMMPVLVLTGFALARPRPAGWRTIVLLAPWVWATAQSVDHALNVPYSGAWAAYDALAAAAADADEPLGPDTVVVWPDQAFSAPAAAHDFRYTSGNSGLEIGPVNWSTRHHTDIAATAFDRADPYWLVCTYCDRLWPLIDALGLTRRLVAAPSEALDEKLAVWRVTPR